MNERLQNLLKDIKSIFIPVVEDNPLKNLKSSDTIRKERYKKYKRRVMMLFIFVPIIFFFLYVIIKTFIIYKAQQDKAVVTQNIPKKDLKLEINSFTRWQDIKDKEDEKLNKDIENLSLKVDEVKNEVSTKIDESDKKISENIENMNTNMTKTLNDNQENLKNLLGNEREKNKTEINGVIESFNTQLKSVEENVTLKLKDLKVTGDDSKSVSIKLPELPSLNTLNENEDSLADKEMFKNNETVSFGSNNYSEELVEVEEEPEIKVYESSTLSKYIEEEKKEEMTMPKFTIMPGFLKGVIVAGADVPTLEQSASEPKPIWLSINSEQLIANSKFSNMKDCLIEAIATGDIGTQRGRFALKTLSCSLTDLSGNDYKIVTPIKGNVYGEDGKIGAKGRLVSREGEIIEKGVPLAVLEGLIQTLSKSNTYVYPSGQGVSNSPNPMNEFADAGAGTGNKILSKFSEYYLKILESLNPYVEIKAKRVVTIAISDAIEVTPVKYTPFDVNYFVEKDFNEDGNEDEENY